VIKNINRFVFTTSKNGNQLYLFILVTIEVHENILAFSVSTNKRKNNVTEINYE